VGAQTVNIRLLRKVSIDGLVLVGHLLNVKAMFGEFAPSHPQPRSSVLILGEPYHRGSDLSRGANISQKPVVSIPQSPRHSTRALSPNGGHAERHRFNQGHRK